MEFREIMLGEKIFLALILYIDIPIMAASIIMLDVAITLCSILYKVTMKPYSNS